MTLIKRFALTAVLAGISSYAASPSHAFMMAASDEAAAQASVDFAASVDSLRGELNGGEIKCDVMLGKIDSAIEQIDAALDQGVFDEKKYLGLRDELVEMRLDLPCLASELAQDMGDGSVVVSEQVIGETVVGDDAGGTSIGSTNAYGSSGMLSSGGGGGAIGGGGAAGGGGIGPLALGGIAAAIAIPLAVTSDNPGDVASPSQSSDN